MHGYVYLANISTLHLAHMQAHFAQLLTLSSQAKTGYALTHSELVGSNPDPARPPPSRGVA